MTNNLAGSLRRNAMQRALMDAMDAVKDRFISNALEGVINIKIELIQAGSTEMIECNDKVELP